MIALSKAVCDAYPAEASNTVKNDNDYFEYVLIIRFLTGRNKLASQLNSTFRELFFEMIVSVLVRLLWLLLLFCYLLRLDEWVETKKLINKDIFKPSSQKLLSSVYLNRL